MDNARLHRETQHIAERHAALAREDLDTFCDELLAGMATDRAFLGARTPAQP
ncbi:hypothetical protein ACIQ6Y_32110 [Streptomyces sp. NPDC096205]|uniref:hypothetical protein n=1 Tax=Streptomyces sp. NPDC096205 TaxID=3366081 RepID=UPI00382F7576